MIKKILKELKKNKKGASMIEFTYSMLLFLTLVIAGFEFFMMGYKYMTVSNFANELASTIARQGGVQTSAPRGYSSGGTNYQTSGNIIESVNRLGRKIGQDSNDITVRVTYQPEGSNIFRTDNLTGASNIEIPYGNRFEITVDYVFRFRLLNQIVILNDSHIIERTKGDVSQFEHDYES